MKCVKIIATTLSLAALSGLTGADEISLAQRAALALVTEAEPTPAAAMASPVTEKTEAYPWDQVLDPPKATGKTAILDSPEAAPRSVGQEEDSPMASPAPVEETPAQRYYRAVEDSRLLLPQTPWDYLGGILKRMEANPLPALSTAKTPTSLE